MGLATIDNSGMMQVAPANSNLAPSITTNGQSTVQNIAQALQQAQGVQNLSNGVVYNIFTMPTSFTATIYSNNGGGAATTTVYLFNAGILNSAVTTNGSGAASIATTYGDGFSGNVYNQYFRSANNGMGVKFVGFTVIATNYTTGAQTASPLTTLSMNLINANGQGGTIPIPFDLSEALRNTQYQSGTLSVLKSWYQNGLNQFSMSLTANTQLNFVFFTEASSFKG